MLTAGSKETMADCNQEEADTRIVILHALNTGCRVICIRTVGTYVIVILLGKIHIVSQQYPDADVWVGFGFGRNFLSYHLNDMYDSIGVPRSRGFPVFLALTGCDTTSAFMNRGKATVWQTWLGTPEVTDAFVYLAENPFVIADRDSPEFKAVEKFIVRLYNKSSDSNSVNETRKTLFCQKTIKNLNRLPPTQVGTIPNFQSGISKLR